MTTYKIASSRNCALVTEDERVLCLSCANSLYTSVKVDAVLQTRPKSGALRVMSASPSLRCFTCQKLIR